MIDNAFPKESKKKLQVSLKASEHTEMDMFVMSYTINRDLLCRATRGGGATDRLKGETPRLIRWLSICMGYECNPFVLAVGISLKSLNVHITNPLFYCHIVNSHPRRQTSLLLGCAFRALERGSNEQQHILGIVKYVTWSNPLTYALNNSAFPERQRAWRTAFARFEVALQSTSH